MNADSSQVLWYLFCGSLHADFKRTESASALASYSHGFSDPRIKSGRRGEGGWRYPQAAPRSWIINPAPRSTFDRARFKGMKDAKREMRGRYERVSTLFHENIEISAGVYRSFWRSDPIFVKIVPKIYSGVEDMSHLVFMTELYAQAFSSKYVKLHMQNWRDRKIWNIVATMVEGIKINPFYHVLWSAIRRIFLVRIRTRKIIYMLLK